MKLAKLYETHVNTRNLEKAIEFYQSLDLELAYVVKERRVAFFWLGDNTVKEQMLGVWEVPEEKFTTSHFAFGVSLETLMEVPSYLEKRGIKLRPSFGEETTDPEVHTWMPAASYYFRDPDGNSLEYIALLEGSPRPELGRIRLSDWNKRK
ncbi:VOC family protein [Neobacillus cucumis]|uniref:VOC family protein n=1 Tax=Neobacillus cucumis TaxID=1740721 RepID=A0A2N5H7E7_9BACI|nr:VOC family protein [Neobacillus cucumis]PLS01420.1 VOC family protein [Neobacillus cucumis]